MIQAAVVQFPGSNSDTDAFKALSFFPEDCGVKYHWHDEPIEQEQYNLIVIPGGFSFGDYLRAGAIAKLSRAVQTLEPVIKAGAHVIGICNGFQILLEAGVLPGRLQANTSLQFISRVETVVVKKAAPPWFRKQDIGRKLKFPIAHRFGNYQPGDHDDDLSVLQYEDNPNGSFQSTAGIYKKIGEGSVFGLMPHPERASDERLGLSDGRVVWENLWREQA